MRIAVIGTGYVGLVTGCCLAALGHTVACVDNDKEKISKLRSGEPTIYEDGLADLLQTGIAKQTLSFTTSLKAGVKDADVIFLALPTPPHTDGSADLSVVLSVAKKLGPLLPKTGCVIVNKSTVPVGTRDKVLQAIAAGATTSFDVVSNPEFLREGLAIKDFMEPERIVIGAATDHAASVMRAVYDPLITSATTLFVTTPQTAELSKYAANTFLTTKINFMNEIAQLCERVDADVESLRRIIGSDSRIGPKFLNPGIGAGGSCFPKDVRALRHMAREHGSELKLIDAAIAVNQRQHHVLVNKIKDHFNGDLAGKTFAFWGLAFKPKTDDIRESPALHVLDELLALGARIRAHDPAAITNTRQKYGDHDSIEYADDHYDAARGCDGLVIATEWDHFKNADLPKLRRALAAPLIFDGRNIFSPDTMKQTGFTYYSIGRRPILQD